jgi:hypothetical protein
VTYVSVVKASAVRVDIHVLHQLCDNRKRETSASRQPTHKMLRALTSDVVVTLRSDASAGNVDREMALDLARTHQRRKQASGETKYGKLR